MASLGRGHRQLRSTDSRRDCSDLLSWQDGQTRRDTQGSSQELQTHVRGWVGQGQGGGEGTTVPLPTPGLPDLPTLAGTSGQAE